MKLKTKIPLAILVGFGMVAFWRGAWRLMDLYLFPTNLEISAWTSIAIGLLILWLTQRLIKKLM